MDRSHRLPPSRALFDATQGNTGPIQQILADRESTIVAAQMRAALNDLYDVLAAERRIRDEAERRLADLAGAFDPGSRLVLGLVILALGTLLGIGGNLAGSA